MWAMGGAEESKLQDVLALRALVEQYAQAVDAGDSSAFVAVFTPDGHLAADDGVTVTDFYGREQLAQIPDGAKGIAATTMHFLGNHVVEIHGDSATGVAYCAANHLRADRSNLVMMVRYLDRYRRGSNGEWLIADRRVVIEWTETHEADPPGL